MVKWSITSGLWAEIWIWLALIQTYYHFECKICKSCLQLQTSVNFDSVKASDLWGCNQELSGLGTFVFRMSLITIAANKDAHILTNLHYIFLHAVILHLSQKTNKQARAHQIHTKNNRAENVYTFFARLCPKVYKLQGDFQDIKQIILEPQNLWGKVFQGTGFEAPCNTGLHRWIFLMYFSWVLICSLMPMDSLLDRLLTGWFDQTVISHFLDCLYGIEKREGCS